MKTFDADRNDVITHDEVSELFVNPENGEKDKVGVMKTIICLRKHLGEKFDTALKQLIAELDGDWNRKVGKEELKNWEGKIQIYQGFSADKLMEQFDKNGDGQLSEEEMRAIFTNSDGALDVAGVTELLQALQMRKRAEFDAALKALIIEMDSDGNRKIGEAELKKCYPISAAHIMQKLDKNSDGQLTTEEIEPMFRNLDGTLNVAGVCGIVQALQDRKKEQNLLKVVQEEEEDKSVGGDIFPDEETDKQKEDQVGGDVLS